MTDLLYGWMSALVLTFLLVQRLPNGDLRCAPGWYVEGVRPSGKSSCVQSPPRNCGEPVPPHNQPCPDGSRFDVQIYCTNGLIPLVIDHRTLGCRRRP